MSPNEITRSSLLDLLFEHRNKQYGAYVLRKYYANRLSLSLGIMLAPVLLLLFIMNVLSGKPGRGFLPPEKITDIVLQQAPQSPESPKPDVRKAAPAHRQAATQTFVDNIRIARGPVDFPDQDKLAGSAISTQTVSGATPGEGPAPTPGTFTQGAVTAPDPEPAVEAPSAPPSFPGGMKAWSEFLGRNLQAPADMEPGEKRSVLVRFWVDEEGTVGRFEFLQSGGHSFDNEVLRVLRKMPKWKPALQRGHAVATSFVQPVTFQAPDE